MNLKLFGRTCKVEVVLVCILVGFFLARVVFPSQEGMMTLHPGSINDNKDYQNKSDPHEITNEQEQMFMFANTKFSPDCCPATYTSSRGCACLDKKQVDFLSKRGMNQTCGCSEY
jgi:hypothetical protein